MRERHFTHLPLVIGLVVHGIIASTTGLLLLRHLSDLYRTVDLGYRQSEQTFYDWLAPAVGKYGFESNYLAKVIAQRLLVMPSTDRRDAVNSMMIDVFWDELAPPGTYRKPVFTLMDKSARIALATDPLSSELWLFAAWLRTNTSGFDEKAYDYLVLSQRFAPRESALAMQRLDFITQLVESPSLEAKAIALADLSVVQQIDTRAAAVYSEQLRQ